MVLDAVLGERRASSGWAPSATRSSTSSTATSLRSNELPHLVFGAAPGQDVRYFPDKLPIGVTARRSHPRVPVPREPRSTGGLPRLPTSARGAAASAARVGASTCSCRATCWRRRRSSSRLRERSSAVPLRLGRRGRACAGTSGSKTRSISGGAPEDCRRYRRACRAFTAPRFRALYRLWKKNGDRARGRHRVAGARGRRSRAGGGHVTSEVLPHVYAHLSPLVGSA